MSFAMEHYYIKNIPKPINPLIQHFSLFPFISFAPFDVSFYNNVASPVNSISTNG